MNKRMQNGDNLLKTRHSFSHVLMQALERLYGAVPGVGPAIDNGFYHDFDADHQVTEDDLPHIEEEMRMIINEKLKIEKLVMPAREGIEELKRKKYVYTVELAEELLEAGEREISFYRQGDFMNMCKGPHVATTGELDPGAFKLTKVAGAYWKGDEKNKMIQRIYGAAFLEKEALDEHLKMLEEAEKRDHRKLGRELDLFHIDEVVGLGLPLWHPKGARLWRIIEDFWYREHLKSGYELVRSPHIGNRRLWEASGHWGFYNDSMYPPLEVGQTLKESQDKEAVKESEQFLLKPMNCPFHIQIYKKNIRSYRELPLRWAECGTVYRYEKKGELSGLTRVRGFTQDDAHIVCRPDQVEEELKRVVDFILFIYKSFGFEISSVNVYLSVRDPQSGKYAGTDEGWAFTEEVLERVARDKGLNITKDVGGAVFYGPKLDFKVKDAIGREWQCSTLQFDFNLPERFDMSFVNAKGGKERPYVLHRALFGSFERFIGVLIEHYAGAFPVWLAPVQARILSVSERHSGFSRKLESELRALGVRAEIDDSDETVGNKIRKAAGEKIPYIIVAGDKEMETGRLAVRDRGKKDTRELTASELAEEIMKLMPADA